MNTSSMPELNFIKKQIRSQAKGIKGWFLKKMDSRIGKKDGKKNLPRELTGGPVTSPTLQDRVIKARQTEEQIDLAVTERYSELDDVIKNCTEKIQTLQTTQSTIEASITSPPPDTDVGYLQLQLHKVQLETSRFEEVLTSSENEKEALEKFVERLKHDNRTVRDQRIFHYWHGALRTNSDIEPMPDIPALVKQYSVNQ